MTDGVPIDVFVEVVEALEAAAGELDELNNTDQEAMPTPDTPADLQALLDSRAAMLAVLSRLKQADPAKIGRLTVEQWQAHLKAAYEEELAKADVDYEMPVATIPVLDEVLKHVTEVRENLQRRALSDQALAEAIRQAAPKGWAW